MVNVGLNAPNSWAFIAAVKSTPTSSLSPSTTQVWAAAPLKANVSARVLS
jgi:hypothetical protein